MASNQPPATQKSWDSDSDSELSDSPSLEEFAETERFMQLPTALKTPKRSIRDKNLNPRKRARLSRGTYRESSTSPSPLVRKRKQPRPTKSSKPQKEDLESEQDESDDEPTPIIRFEPGASPSERKAFEKVSLKGEHLAPSQRLPGEILDPIAIYIHSDADLANTRLVDQRFLDTISSDNHTIWKQRFLTRWDAPFVTSVYQYGPAYKERHFVITRVIGFADGEDPRVEIHLRTFQEMVLETFNSVQTGFPIPPPTFSLNLAAFTSPSEWMKSLLSAPFFGHGGRGNYGKPEPLFDALQLTFAFLLLSPKYPLAKIVAFSRTDYDIAKVYNWNVPFQTLFKRLPAPPPHLAFPNLSRLPSIGGVTVYEYSLNTNDLVHIRNFFQRHLVHDSMGKNWMGEIPEETFYRSNKQLTQLGHIPKPWTAPLQNLDANLGGILTGSWLGFYSTVHPWPKKNHDLVELQTDAFDYSHVDPLTLRFAVNTTNIKRGAVIWPDTFKDIPCFETTVPSSLATAQLRDGGLGATFFLRGTAPFMNLDGQREITKSPQEEFDKYHPVNALRLRGVIHPLPAEFDLPTPNNQQGQAAATPVPIVMKPPLPIPGFRRVVLVLYKPAITELIKQLEFADETFGSMFGVALTAQVDQDMAHELSQIINNGGDLPEEAVNHLRRYLEGLVQKREQEGAEENDETKGKWTKEELEALETGFHKDGQLSWIDIEYAYAYEGIICPGGNVMMGRWWRVGMAGMGANAGCEIDGDGLGVWDGEGEGPPEGATAEKKKLERGPFVFWPMAN